MKETAAAVQGSPKRAPGPGVMPNEQAPPTAVESGVRVSLSELLAESDKLRGENDKLRGENERLAGDVSAGHAGAK